jgi:LysM repeat protein
MIRIVVLLLNCCLWVTAFSQAPPEKLTREEYIHLYKEIAIEEMNIYHIPASITLAQGILESGNGNSTLARKANNHFGIKCHRGWNGKTFHMDDDARNECFRKYSSPYESFKDHSIFLSTRDRYAFLFDLDIFDYKGWANGLKRAGYATNPRYPQLLIKLIEENELYTYDQFYNGRVLAQSQTTYQPPPAADDDFIPITIGAANREIFENNGVKYILARADDTFYKIAQDFNIYTWQVYRYNDLKKNDPIDEGEKIYLEKKRKKAKSKVHIVQPGETLHDIAQFYAVRINKLCKYNSLNKDTQLYPNQQIKLRK